MIPFSELADDEQTRLRQRFQSLNLPGETVLVTEGEPNQGLWLLTSGVACVHVQGADGRELLVEIGPGAWVGEISFLDPGPAGATVTARGAITALHLSRAALTHLLDEEPALAAALLRLLSKDLAARMRAWDQRLTRPDDGDDAGFLARLFGGGR